MYPLRGHLFHPSTSSSRFPGQSTDQPSRSSGGVVVVRGCGLPRGAAILQVWLEPLSQSVGCVSGPGLLVGDLGVHRSDQFRCCNNQFNRNKRRHRQLKRHGETGQSSAGPISSVVRRSERWVRSKELDDIGYITLSTSLTCSGTRLLSGATCIACASISMETPRCTIPRVPPEETSPASASSSTAQPEARPATAAVRGPPAASR